jgi:hypothetical protein
MADVGRPTDYKPEYVDMVYKLCLLGATDAQMADLIGVSETTFHNWKLKHPEFLESITRGKVVADAEIAESLFHRAKGYSHEAVKIFNNQGEIIEAPYREHYPPDTQAASLWLRNRQPALWRDKTETDINVTGSLAELIEAGRKRIEQGG